VRLDGRHGGDDLLAGGRGAGFIAQHLEDVAERIEHDWLIVYQNAVTAPSATRSASRSIRVTLRVPAEAAADGSTVRMNKSPQAVAASSFLRSASSAASSRWRSSIVELA
jgi:hypothetical protein